MTETTSENIENSEGMASNLTLGELFQQTRLKQNISLDDVCQKINLRPILVTQLENNEFNCENIPVAFMKGYIRSYAKFLQLPDSCYTQVFNSLSDEHKNDLGKNTRIMKHVNNHSAHSHRLGYFSLFIILVLIVMTALWWWQNYQQTEKARDTLVENYIEQPGAQNLQQGSILNNDSTSTPTTLPAVTNESDSSVTPATETEEKEVGESKKKVSTVEQDNLNQQTLTSTSILEKAMLDAKKDNTASKTLNNTENVKNTAVLQIKIKGDCWLSVKDKNNKVLAQKLYHPGETLDFYKKSSYSLVIGSPKNVEITYKGKLYPLSINGKVAKVQLS